MKLEFSGSPEIAAGRERVWLRLMDPHFVAKSAPGVESVEVIDPSHFKVVSGFGVGSMRIGFTMDVEMMDIVPRRSAGMRIRGKAPGSAVDVVSSIEIQDAARDSVRLNWSATSDIQRLRRWHRGPADGGGGAEVDRAVLGRLCPAGGGGVRVRAWVYYRSGTSSSMMGPRSVP